MGTYLAIGSDLRGAYHTSTFDLDEAVLGPGVDLLEHAVRAVLSGSPRTPAGPGRAGP